jgi:hypothetical protein
MQNHVPLPSLCKACEARAYTLAEMGPPEDSVIKRCDCGGANQTVIAVASKSRGRIVHWHIEGPMSAEQARVLGAAILKTFANAGMQIHDLPTQ